MKRLKVFNLFLLMCIFVGVERFCRWQTGGFRIAKASTSHCYLPCKEPPYTNLVLPLNQPFYFLGSGVQFYAFIGADHQTVLKLFKHYHTGFSLEFMKSFFPQRLTASILKTRENRMHPLFKSVQIAAHALPKETGVFYIHLEKTENYLGKITLFDKLHIAHQVDLDQTEFLLQHKATPFDLYLKSLFDQQKTTEIHAVIQTLLGLIQARREKGVQNNDFHLIRNLGVLDNKELIELDVGSFAYIEDAKNTDQERKKTLENLSRWIKNHYPNSYDNYRDLFAL